MSTDWPSEDEIAAAPQVNGFSFWEALATVCLSASPKTQPLADYVASAEPLTPSMRQHLADWLRSLAPERPPWRPSMQSLDPDMASDVLRVQLAQHEAARIVIAKGGNATKAAVADAINQIAKTCNILPSKLSERAVRTRVKNEKAQRRRG